MLTSNFQAKTKSVIPTLGKSTRDVGRNEVLSSYQQQAAPDQLISAGILCLATPMGLR